MKNFIKEYQVGRGIWVFFKFTFGILLIAMLWFGYHDYMLRSQQLTKPVSLPTATTGPRAGSIYFTAVGEGTSTNVSIYAYHLTTDVIDPVMSNHFATSFFRGISSNDLATAYAASSTEPDHFGPVWLNVETKRFGSLPGVQGYNETGIVGSPDLVHYAFAFQSAQNIDPINIDGWSVAIIDGTTKETIVLRNAAKPHWAQHGADLLYMKSDGLYEYNMATHQSHLVAPSRGILNTNDDFTVSGNSQWLVFTAPGFSFMSVFKASITASTTWQQIGGIVTPHMHYRTPVIAPNNDYYAVTAVSDADYATSSGRYTKAALQIYPLSSTTMPTLVLPLVGQRPDSVQLDEWYTY